MSSRPCGAEANVRLLIHFLNAVLGADLPGPVAEVEILNPYNEREFLDDKLSIVDVQAREGQGRVFQVEIQLLVPPELPARILYGWTDLYSAQLHSGQDYGELRPTYSIWLLDEQDLPEWMQTEEMRQAMSTVNTFSEKEREYHAYQARQNYLRQQRSIQRRLDDLQAAAEQSRLTAERERADKEAALAREAAALAEIERLRCLLEEKPGT